MDTPDGLSHGACSALTAPATLLHAGRAAVRPLHSARTRPGGICLRPGEVTRREPAGQVLERLTGHHPVTLVDSDSPLQQRVSGSRIEVSRGPADPATAAR
jgi:hypothetical protein